MWRARFVVTELVIFRSYEGSVHDYNRLLWVFIAKPIYRNHSNLKFKPSKARRYMEGKGDQLRGNQ